MLEKPLRERVKHLFESALRRMEGHPELARLHRELRQGQDRLEQPMRVAVVGLIKAGKSTMMNALLGDDVVATGALEATFNVNWLLYGKAPSLEVSFKDGRSAETKTYEELRALTLRAEESQEYLLSIKHIKVFYPNQLLQSFNLIDTPGLASSYEADSRNTEEFLRLHGDQLTTATQEEFASADAVLYLFGQSMAEMDKRTLEDFLGPAVGRTSPVNAIGALTKIDHCWSDYDDPMEGARKIVNRLQEDPLVRPLLYAIYPVSGLLAFGAQTLQKEEFESLEALASMPEERFERLVRNSGRFRREYDLSDVPVPAAAREHLMNWRLGQYGIWLACRLIRQGLADRESLSKELLKRSGILELRELIISHFGARAFLIKLGSILPQVMAACSEERQRLEGEPLRIAAELALEFERLSAQEHAFDELRALRGYYAGTLKLQFSQEEVEHLLEVTGEYGSSCGNRLGLPADAPLDQMKVRAMERIQHWRERCTDYIRAGGQGRDAARVLTESYEQIAYRVQQAERYFSPLPQARALSFQFGKSGADLEEPGEQEDEEVLDAQEHAKSERRVLQRHREGRLTLSEEETKHLLEVTGHSGDSYAERLGLRSGASLAEMMAAAKERARYWRLRSGDHIGTDGRTLEAARVLASSYERILYRLNQAKQCLLA